MGFIYGIAKAVRDFLCLLLEPGFILPWKTACPQLCPARILPTTRSLSYLCWPHRPALRRASSLTKSPCVPGPQLSKAAFHRRMAIGPDDRNFSWLVRGPETAFPAGSICLFLHQPLTLFPCEVRVSGRVDLRAYVTDCT